jgi:general secretion pathway protein G
VSCRIPKFVSHKRGLADEAGLSLFEMIVTLVVLSILVLGTVPLAQNSVKRGKEAKLRDALAQMRSAIDEFRRDAVGACIAGQLTSGNPTLPGGGTNVAADPRSRVLIDDCTIFDTLNLDRHPPSLEILVQGVRVKARGFAMTPGTVITSGNATESNPNEDIIKVYLREIPTDPITGRSDTWRVLSSYQRADSSSWDRINVFDVRSGSDLESLAGDKYRDW